LGGRNGIQPVKKQEWWGAGVVVSLEQGADLNMAQLMPLPLSVSFFSKIQISFTFLVPAHLGSPGKGPLDGCECVCAPCCVVYDSCAQRYAHKYQQFLNLWLVADSKD